MFSDMTLLQYINSEDRGFFCLIWVQMDYS